MSTTSITLEIDPVRLADPHVAKAVAAVMLALDKAGGRASAPAAPTGGDEAGENYRAFYTQLPETSQSFLDLLEKAGTLTISQAVSQLGLAKPKSLGGITGAISRWAPARGAKVPFEKLTIEGERAWRWTGA